MKKIFYMLICALMLVSCGDGGNGQAPNIKTSTKTVHAVASNSTRAKVFLESGGDSYIVSNSGTTLYGGTGNDTVTIADGVTGVTIDQNVEQINFSSSLSNYKFLQTGNLINVYDSAGSTLILSSPVQGDSDGAILSFSDWSASALMASGGTMTLGGMTVSSTAANVLIPNTATTTTTTSTTSTTLSPLPGADGTALYNSNCSGCHAALSTSSKAGTTASNIQSAINGDIGGMSSLSSLSPTEIDAIATALASVVTPVTPTPVCGSCHAIPPSTGQHSRHRSKGVSCAICHGSAYSTTSFNAATHNNGIKNVVSTIGWNSTSRTCSNSCHGNERW